MPTSANDLPPAVDVQTGRLICTTIALQLRQEFDEAPSTLPLRLAVLLERIQHGDDEPH